jgi:hypothetical protein
MTSSETSRLDRHEARLADLERQNRRLRRTNLAAMATLLALPLLAFAAPRGTADEVRARAFLLVDDDGTVRARLHLEDGATPSFEMTDLDGKRRLDLYVKGPEPFAALLDAKEQTRLGLGVDGGNLPHAVLYDELQRPRMHLSVGPAGLGAVTCLSKAGTIDAGLGIDPDTGPWIRPAPKRDD